MVLTKITEIKDFLMIYLWNLISDQVAGNTIEFSKRTEVIISEQKRDFELTLSAAVIAIFMAFGLSYSTLTTVYKTSVD